MKKPFPQELQELRLHSYVDSICFENVGGVFSIKIVNREWNSVYFLRDIILLNFSQNFLNPRDTDEDYVDIIDATHEYREVNHNDLKEYSFSTEDIIDTSVSLHIITIICEKIVKRS